MSDTHSLPFNPFSPTELEARAGRILVQLEISMVSTGYIYLCVAIAEAYKDPSVTEYVTKTLVPRVAKRCNQKPACVHRSMTRAIDYMRKYPNKRAKLKYLGNENAPADLLGVVTGVANYLRNEDSRHFD